MNRQEKKQRSLEEMQQIALLKGIIKGFKLDKISDILPSERPKRRLIVKYFLFPLYSVGFPIITILLFYTKHYIFGIFGILFTLYGWFKMFMGDRLILWLMKPFLKRLLR